MIKTIGMVTMAVTRSLRPLTAALLLAAPLAWGDDIEARLAAAREQLDAAAAQLAALQAEMYENELHGGQARRAMLGVLLDVKAPEGLVLSGVTPGGGAAEAGLLAGDRLLAIDGSRLDGTDDPMAVLQSRLAEVEPGEAVTLEYQRGDSVLAADVVTQTRGPFIMRLGDVDLEIDLEELEKLADVKLEALEELGNLEVLHDLEQVIEAALHAVPDIEIQQRIADRAGLELTDVTGDLAHYFGATRGALVLAPGAAAGVLTSGDVITAVGGDAVDDAEDAYAALAERREGAEVDVQLLRRGEALTLDLATEPFTDSLSSRRVISIETRPPRPPRPPQAPAPAGEDASG